MYWAQDLDETDQEKVDQLVREGGYRMYDAFQALAINGWSLKRAREYLEDQHSLSKIATFKRTYQDPYSDYNKDEVDFLNDTEPLKLEERIRNKNHPVGLRNIGNTCYFNCIIQILFFLPCFGKRILELDINKIFPAQKGRKSKVDKETKKIENSKKFLSNLQQLFVELTLSNRKYANPIDLIKSVVDENGNQIHIGDEEDVGEICSRFMNALHESFAYFDKVEETSDEENNNDDDDTDANELSNSGEEEEEKIPVKTRRNTTRNKREIKALGYGPKAFGRELFKDPQDKSRGFIKNLFFGTKMEITERESRVSDNVEETEFIQVFLSVLNDSNLYEAWDSSYNFEVDGNDKHSVNKRNYIMSIPNVLTFQLMRATYDFNENKLK